MATYYEPISSNSPADAVTWNQRFATFDNALVATLPKFHLSDPRYDGLANGNIVYDAITAAGSEIVYSPSGLFLPTHAGMSAAAWGANINGRGLAGSIHHYIDSQHVALDVAATLALTNIPFAWGTAQDDIVNGLLDDLEDDGGGEVLIPAGIWIFDTRILPRSRTTFKGMGRGATWLVMVGEGRLFNDFVGGHSDMTWKDLTMLHVGAGWTGNHQTIRMDTQTGNTDIRILDCDFIGSVRTTQMLNCKRVWVQRNHFIPLMGGMQQINITSHTLDQGSPSPCEEVFVTDNIFSAWAVGRTDFLLDPGDTNTKNTSMTGQAAINLQVRNSFIGFNYVEATTFLGILAEGEQNHDVDIVHNVVRAAPNFPTVNSLGGISGIFSKIGKGCRINFNKIYGTDTTKVMSGGFRSTGIKFSPGHANPDSPFGEEHQCIGNTVYKYTRGYHYGDASVSDPPGDFAPAGSFVCYDNTFIDCGEHFMFVELNVNDTTTTVAKIKRNTMRGVEATSVAETLLRMGGNLRLEYEDNAFENVSGMTRMDSIAGTAGTNLVIGGNTNDLGNRVFDAGDLDGYLGTLEVKDLIRLRVPETALGGAAITHYVGMLNQYSEYVFVGYSVEYTVASGAGAAGNVIVRADATEILETYITVANQAQFTYAEVGITGVTTARFPTARTGVRVEFPGGIAHGGSIIMELWFMRN